MSLTEVLILSPPSAVTDTPSVPSYSMATSLGSAPARTVKLYFSARAAP